MLNVCVQVENAKMYGAEVEKADVQVGTLPASTTLRFAGSHLRLLHNGLLKSLILLYTWIRASRKSFNVPKENYACWLAPHWPLQNVCPCISYTINWYMFGSHVFAMLPCSYASVWWWTFKMLPSEMEVGSPEAISGTYTPECTFSKS